MEQYQLPRFGELPSQQTEFLTARRERVTAMLPGYRELRARLLGFGGLEVVLPRYDELSEPEQQRQAYDVKAVLDRGETWAGARAAVEAGAENSCHTNVARLASAERGNIASGWALADDGLWREHSWLIDRAGEAVGQLVETTQPWLLYHGYRLDSRESSWFIHDELGPEAPVPGAA